MLTESYGGTCPNCGYDRLMVRYGSSGYAHHDICPNCCFGFCEYSIRSENGKGWEPAHVRDMELIEGEIYLLKEQIKKIGGPLGHIGLLLYIESLSDIDEIEHVFDYDNWDWEEHDRLAQKRTGFAEKLEEQRKGDN